MSSCYDWLARNWVQNPRQIGFVLANAVFSLKTVTFDDASWLKMSKTGVDFVPSTRLSSDSVVRQVNKVRFLLRKQGKTYWKPKTHIKIHLLLLKFAYSRWFSFWKLLEVADLHEDKKIVERIFLCYEFWTLKFDIANASLSGEMPCKKLMKERRK